MGKFDGDGLVNLLPHHHMGVEFHFPFGNKHVGFMGVACRNHTYRAYKGRKIEEVVNYERRRGYEAYLGCYCQNKKGERRKKVGKAGLCSPCYISAYP
jgi:hypothetical protein